MSSPLAGGRPGLGRLPAPDPRDARYPLSVALERIAPTRVPATRLWAPGPILDQGQTSECVGYSWRQFLQTDPPRDVDPHPTGDEIYALAQANDEWAGTPHDGSSVRGGAKGLATDGLLSAYAWADSLDALAAWVLAQGPVVVGTTWYEAMFTPHRGIVAPGGAVAGGHAYLCVGYARRSRLFTFCNSWGADWGVKGLFKMRAGDVARLVFAEGGEACTATEAAPTGGGLA